MKAWKKVLCLLAVMVIGLSCVVPAFAASDGAVELWQYGDMQLPKIPATSTGDLIYRSGDKIYYVDCLYVSYSESNVVYCNDPYKLYELSSSSWILIGESSLSDYVIKSPDFSQFIYCDKDIVKGDGTVLFQRAPNPPELVKPFQIVEEAGQLSPVMTEVLSLIPLLIVSIVGFLALRKAWQFLLGQLRRA